MKEWEVTVELTGKVRVAARDSDEALERAKAAVTMHAHDPDTDEVLRCDETDVRAAWPHRVDDQCPDCKGRGRRDWYGPYQMNATHPYAKGGECTCERCQGRGYIGTRKEKP